MRESTPIISSSWYPRGWAVRTITQRRYSADRAGRIRVYGAQRTGGRGQCPVCRPFQLRLPYRKTIRSVLNTRRRTSIYGS